MQKQHEQCQQGAGGFVSQRVPWFNDQRAAQQDGADDEPAIAEYQAEVGQVPKGNNQEQDIHQDERCEKVVIEEVVGVV